MLRRRIAVSLAFATASLLAIACGGTVAGDGNGGGAGSGPGSACDNFYPAYEVLLGCYGDDLPASELARLRPRFDELCAKEQTLPGSGLTPAGLDSCGKALVGWNCQAATTPPECTAVFNGTEAGGESCVAGEQCASGDCEFGVVVDEAGVESPSSSSCGRCTAAIPVGGACQNGGSCAPGATCDGQPATCQTITYGAAGASCDQAAHQCGAALVCGSSSGSIGTCVAAGAVGAACTQGSDCASGLTCVTEKCAALPTAGQKCGDSGECATGFSCGSGGTCAAASWAEAGQPCGNGANCLVGFCNVAGDDGADVCPAIIPDGQPCDPASSTTTCDSLASCQGGICVVPGAVTCQ